MTGLEFQRVKRPRWWNMWLSRKLRTQTELELQTQNTPKACPQCHTSSNKAMCPKQCRVLWTEVFKCLRLWGTFAIQSLWHHVSTTPIIQYFICPVDSSVHCLENACGSEAAHPGFMSQLSPGRVGRQAPQGGGVVSLSAKGLCSSVVL